MNQIDLFEVTLTLDTNQYASGDLLADTQEIAGACNTISGRAILRSIAVLDEDDQGGALDLLLLRSNTSMGTENGAFAPVDGDAEEILTVIEIASGDYVDFANSQMAMKTEMTGGVGAVLEPASGTSLYVAVVSRDTKTYSAAGIVLKIGLER